MFIKPLNRRRDEDGFTLIELLVVVVILGILIGIAIPVYLNYRKNANDKAAQSDLRNAVATMEVCNSEGAYPTSVPATGGTVCTSQTVSRSDNTTFAYALKTDGSAYIMSTTNTGGSGKIYCYSSAAGGSVTTTTTAVTAYRAAC